MVASASKTITNGRNGGYAGVYRLHRACHFIQAIPLCFGLVMSCLNSFAGNDNASLISVSITNGAPMMPRTMFTQTWTFQNTGTTTWSPGAAGYTLNLVGWDNLGAISLFTNTSSSWFTPSAIIASGKSVAPGAQAAFSVAFIAPEMSGSVTDTFQLNGTTNFGPLVTVQIAVEKAGSTNQYDRSKAISYANNYAGYVCSDGYFWTNSSAFGTFVPHTNAPANPIGDDCAHFVSCCIGNEPHQRGGGMNIPTRDVTYGEPAASRIVNNCLLDPGYAVEVFSLSNLSPGDVIGWNWEGDTNIADLDHVTLYLGEHLLASHSQCVLEVAPTWFQSGSWKWHLIHILDSPTIASARLGKNLVLSWGTNWSGYALYSSTNAAGTNWTKVTKSPVAVGNLNLLTNSIGSGAVFYRLMMP